MRRILCIYLPNWPIQRLLAEREQEGHRAKDARRNREDKESPTALRPASCGLILHARDPRRGELVVACDSAAWQCGVRPDMPLAEATALAGRRQEPEAAAASSPIVLPHDPAADLSALTRLAEHCERYSPIVGWETVEGGDRRRSSALPVFPAPPDFLLLDVTGIGVLFGGEGQLAREVLADLTRQGYECRVAMAGTIGAAWARAKYEGGRNKEDEFALPPAALRLPDETIDLLEQLGIQRLDQLLALPRQSLRARFGERLILRLDQLLGTAQETIVAHRPPPRFIAERILEYPLERRDAIEQMLRDLVEQIARDLAARREGALRLTCRLDCAGGRPVFLDVGLFRPSAEAAHLWDLVQMRLEQASLPGPLGRATVAVTLAAPLVNRQGELFASGEHEAVRHLALLIDRCHSRLGHSAVLQPQLAADPLPERAVRNSKGYRVQGSAKKPKVRGRRKIKKETEWERGQGPELFVAEPPHRPLALLSPPLSLHVVSVVPDGPPRAFRLEGQTHRVVGTWGPERIEAGWWRGRSVRRDYWRVETDTGRRYWLFRRLDDGQWYLHGDFG